jgi:hypothetical protein
LGAWFKWNCKKQEALGSIPSIEEDKKAFVKIK